MADPEQSSQSTCGTSPVAWSWTDSPGHHQTYACSLKEVQKMGLDFCSIIISKEA